MEIQEPNSGRTGFTTFQKRGPLPKAAPAADAGAALPGQARLTPDLCYAPTDLRIGATMAILGRQFLIYDCDAATRQWYTVRGKCVWAGWAWGGGWVGMGRLGHERADRLRAQQSCLGPPHDAPTSLRPNAC